MFTKETLQQAVDELTRQHGEWTYDFPLPFGVWTRGNQGVPHTRLKRVVQTLIDLSGGSLKGRRVLDLGCLEGFFAVECALQGAESVGVEIRESHLAKARLCKDALGLERLSFFRDDVRRISTEKYGKFDFIICSGILYHLPGKDVVDLVRAMHEMTTHAAVIDTHVGLEPQFSIRDNSTEYWGVSFREHEEGTNQNDRAAKGWASWDNPTSFWPTRSSLANLVMNAGFTSVFECLSSPPLDAEIGYGNGDRCAFVALKGTPAQLSMSPAANGLNRRWPEGTLSYAPAPHVSDFLRAAKKRAERRLRQFVRRLDTVVIRQGR